MVATCGPRRRIKIATDKLRESQEERALSDAEGSALPVRRRRLTGDGYHARSGVLLLAALVVEVGWLFALGYLLYRFVA